MSESTPYDVCSFKSGKTYNCDLSASYNIGARYLIRVLFMESPDLQSDDPDISLRNASADGYISFGLCAVLSPNRLADGSLREHKPLEAPSIVRQHLGGEVHDEEFDLIAHPVSSCCMISPAADIPAPVQRIANRRGTLEASRVLH